MSSDTPAPARSRKSAIAIFALVVVLLCYVASPYISFWRFSVALRSGDQIGVAAHVDFPALRESMKKELHARLFGSASTAKPKKDPLQALLQGMAPSLIDALVDAYLTPEGIALLLANPKIAATKNPATVGEAMNSGSAESARRSIDWSKVHYAFFTSARDFLVDVNGTKLRFRVSVAGWRLRAIDLPKDIAAR